MTVYQDFNEFKKSRPDIAKRLLDDVGNGEWMDNELYYHDSLSDYAEYELTEGWYIDLGLYDKDFRLAPNPLDYIDLDGLGEALSYSWDESCHWTNGEIVIETGYGW